MKPYAAICRVYLFFLPLEGEDQGGGQQFFMLPPPLTPPTRGGEFKGCHPVRAKPLAKTDQVRAKPLTKTHHPLGWPRGILACFDNKRMKQHNKETGGNGNKIDTKPG